MPLFISISQEFPTSFVSKVWSTMSTAVVVVVFVVVFVVVVWGEAPDVMMHLFYKVSLLFVNKVVTMEYAICFFYGFISDVHAFTCKNDLSHNSFR